MWIGPKLSIAGVLARRTIAEKTKKGSDCVNLNANTKAGAAIYSRRSVMYQWSLSEQMYIWVLRSRDIHLGTQGGWVEKGGFRKKNGKMDGKVVRKRARKEILKEWTILSESLSAACFQRAF